MGLWVRARKVALSQFKFWLLSGNVLTVKNIPRFLVRFPLVLASRHVSRQSYVQVAFCVLQWQWMDFDFRIYTLYIITCRGMFEIVTIFFVFYILWFGH